MAQSVFQPLKQRIYAWFAKAQTADTDKDLTALPEHIQTQLDQKLQALPTPDLYKTTIRGAIAEAVETWQNEPDASNVLVVLASPTEAIADILNDSLQAWEDLPAKRITPLPCERRPQDPMALLEQIRAALASQEQLDLDEPPTQDRHNTPDLDSRTTLVVVPCLEQCFLRCIDGWSAVEYLRSVAIRNRNCFWVFGCNQLAWNFLDFVSQISAYFGQVVTLPELDGDNLRDWLDPIGQTVIESSQQQDTLQSWLDPLRQQAVEIEQGKDAEDDPRQIYWSSLATQCLGVGAIAARLWQRSLRVTAEEELPPLDPPDQEDKEAGNASRPEPARLTLHQTAPTLPSLPNLTAADRYLLHALLIHGEMTRPHLALSLGETDSETQATVQKLLREDLLEQRHDTLSVQPIYYPKLKTDLGNNNFFLEGE